MLAVLILTFVLGTFQLTAHADQSGASAAISSVKGQIMTCYSAAKEAEAGGANITVLARALNEANVLLSNAESAFTAGDYASAQNYAAQSQARLVNFTSDANALLIASTAQRNQAFSINVVGSICGTVAILVGGTGMWFFLKKEDRQNGE